VTDARERTSRSDADPASRVGGRFAAWVDWVLTTSPALRLAVAIGLLLFVAMLDAVTGAEISFSVFYLVPVAFAGGLVSRRAGWAVAVLSATVWGYLDIAMGHGYSAAWIPYWNSGVRLAFFLLVSELVGMLGTAQAHLRDLSGTDTLTGLANSRVFHKHTDRAIAQARRNGRPFTITYVDLDRFKRVNDELGHSEGDRLLRRSAAVMQESLRTTDLVARLGGDEFAILMPETGMDQAGESLLRVAAAVARDVEDHWVVGATFGAVTFIEPPDDVDSAVRLADDLMYQGKARGRGCILQSTWPESSRIVIEPAAPVAREEATVS
jgi:diguanylate cyclase (GGDEF)-like protein